MWTAPPHVASAVPVHSSSTFPGDQSRVSFILPSLGAPTTPLSFAEPPKPMHVCVRACVPRLPAWGRGNEHPDRSLRSSSHALYPTHLVPPLLCFSRACRHWYSGYFSRQLIYCPPPSLEHKHHEGLTFLFCLLLQLWPPEQGLAQSI